MKIAILTMGTRGDVQPYAILGRALKDRGHEVVLSTAKNFESLIQSYGLNFIPVDADFQSLLNSEEGKKIRKNPFMAKKLLKKFVYPMMTDAFVKFYKLAQQNDKVLFHIKTMADVFADQFPGKMIEADVVPAGQPTNAFPNPVFSSFHLPSFLNKLTFKITTLGLKMWTHPVTEFRLSKGLPKQYKKPYLPSIYGISEALLSKPADYPANSYFTGFWMETSTSELSKDVIDFINAGDAPLLITFGSMPIDSHLNLVELVRSVSEALSIRIILIKGWGVANTDMLNNSPMFKILDSAPYDKLFPLVKAIVNHGGIGTISACLKAGKPFWCCPVLYPLGDQYFWGAIAQKKGVSLKPLPLKKMTTQKFIDNVRKLLKNEQLYVNAQKIAVQLANENGVENAISIIEKYGM